MHSDSSGQPRTQHHLAEEWALTLPWYLILSCCRCRKSRLLVLLLRSVSDRILSCSFSSTSTYKRQDQLNLFSASGTFFTFSFPSCPSPQRSSSPRLSREDKTYELRPKTPAASPPCLHLQFVSSLTAQANVGLSFPPDCRNSSYTSHQWAKKKSKEKLLNSPGERRETKRCEGLENLAQSPDCKHVIAPEQFKKKREEKQLKCRDEISVHSFFPSPLFSLLPPFLSHKLGQIHRDVSYGGVPQAQLYVSHYC